MEKQQDDILLKVRSGRSITVAALRLFKTKFIPMLKARWLSIVDTAACITAVGMLLMYGLYFFVPLAAFALLLEKVLWVLVAFWLTDRKAKSWWRSARKHWLLLLGIAIAGVLVTLPLCALVSTPLIILILSEWESQASQTLGDPLGMPSYVIWLAGVVWFITALLCICIRLAIIYVGYFAWGSAEAKRREREQQIKLI